jgi:hypothetical protein
MMKTSALERGVVAAAAGLSLLLLTCSSPSPQPTQRAPAPSYPSPPRQSRQEPTRGYEFMSFMEAYNNKSNLIGQRLELSGSAIDDGREALFYGGTFMASRAIKTDVSIHNSNNVSRVYHGLIMNNNLNPEDMRMRIRGYFERVNGEVIFIVENGTISSGGSSYSF